MVMLDPPLGKITTTSSHNPDLRRNLPKSTQHHAIALSEAVYQVLNVRVLAKVLDERLQGSEVVSRYAREEVVDGLELQTTVDEIEEGRAAHVHGCAELALRKGFGGAEVGG